MMEPWELALLPNESMQRLIDNCVALELDPDLIDQSYVYTTPERIYSQIWTKADVHDDELIYYYYRIQIVGLCKDGYNEEGNYLFVQNWGAFDTINHRKRSDYLPLTQCLQRFVIQSGERTRNFIFARIKENDISKYPLHEFVQELITKYIFDVDFLQKMINEYTFDVKNTITAFLEVTAAVKKNAEMPQRGVQYWGGLNAASPRLSYDKARELLNKTITCLPTDMDEGQSKTFSLMNFYYKQLHTTINVLDKNTARYGIIEKYFNNSQSARHNYTAMQLTNVFEIERPCDNHRYTKHLVNKQLLWHGTHTSNIPSILYEGFKTSKARSSGMFGAGTYFANSVGKSLGYCAAGGEGVLLLCEVALGDTIRCTRSTKQLANQHGELPDGKNSVHGVGSLTPNAYDYVIIDDDVLVPYGNLGDTHGGALLHDEFIVYNPAQIKMRYLITMTYR